ncbi:MULTISPECIES: efflux RND transporter periplasmic adaptor subunit [Acinetobacter]|uniref:Efflux RND transporter periplasmic adaptor subunit n=1 Tax=Acinetobacter haemolyticus TaxID=29430 RepID=A0A1L6KIR0_ACIHA|nr:MULTISPECIES: efflux RND transporter periplasmic adaptor subunit [Acinetobacter]APR68962.1 efflux transporter periplasmic adaptor subunit [Acinetobacter haemolyticus]AZN67762.1 efflux RND transporter periplasmic adaptor subunit [Acinetobacter haemolyticus]EEH68298.1 efflux transporter, RND family, MFP subunit [Acinetobacter sp. ATCC 27244]MCU4379331.1 efflux RND transporter periplasmic adaptor subunit [Acinetobacter haemolyticus]MCU4393778.1 efflux RND transporter periplasmic adaptor subuni
MNLLNHVIVGLLVLSSVTLSACQKELPKTEEIPYVMVTQPSRNHTDQKSYAGDVQARQQTALAFRVGGQVTERYVEVGDRVNVGQVLAKLDVKDAQLQMNAAKAQLQSAEAAAKIATEEYQRYQQLLPVNAVSRSQFDAVKNQYESAQANLQQARSNYQVSANQTGYNQLISNKKGVITQRQIEVGQVVAAGQAAYQLAIDGEREVVFGVPEQAVSAIKVGQPAWVTLWSQPDARFAAKVREVSPAADQSRTFTVKVSLLEGQSSIQLGQSARVFFVSNENDVLSVPLSSVTATDQQAYVWVVNTDKTLRKVPVTLGAYARDRVPVISGLKATDWVVVGGVHLLREQQKIHPIDRENREVLVKTGG